MSAFSGFSLRTGSAFFAAAVWLAGRSRREQVGLLVCLTLLLGAGLTQGLWKPLSARHQELLSDIAEAERGLSVLASLPAAPQTDAALERLPVAEILTSTSEAYDLAIRRLESLPEGATASLDDAAFDALILWLDMLETEHDLRLTALDLARRSEPGLVSARLTLERGGRG